MKKTEWYQFEKPEGNEYVGPPNGNFDKVDGVLHQFEIGKPVKVTVLEEVCRDVALNDETPAYTFPGAIVLDANGLYFLQYRYFTADGTEDLAGGGAVLARVTGENVHWITDQETNRVTLTAGGIADTWRGTGKTAVLTILKVEVSAADAIARCALDLEGYGTAAGGRFAHVEGSQTTAAGQCSHAEGSGAKALGDYSHSEGDGTTASGRDSHAEGQRTTASGYRSHAEGTGTDASGQDSHAEGSGTEASGLVSHAEGDTTDASGDISHAEGNGTTASGSYSHAEGSRTAALGDGSHAAGIDTIANDYQCVVGTYNVEKAATGVSGDRFIIGGGWSPTRRNAFRVHSNGSVYGGTYNASGADYAEYFEWADGNAGRQDRAGLFVTLDGEKLRLAGPEDEYILGLVSAAPSVVGDVYDDQWAGMYLRDVFGRTVMEERDFPAETAPDGTVLREAFRAPAPKLNPDYRPGEAYLPRSQRPEWDAVGLMGKLVAVDDGTCKVNGFCKVGPGGVAIASETPTAYRVLSRLDGDHVRILVR